MAGAKLNKRVNKTQRATASYISKSTSNTPFSMQTRVRARMARNNVAVQISSTHLQASGSGPHVDLTNSLNAQRQSSPLLGVSHSSSDDDRAIFDSFQWNADELSEAASVRHLQNINASIDEALVPVLALLKKRMCYYKNRPNIFNTANHNVTKNLDLRVAAPLVQELYAARRAQSKLLFGDAIIEAFLQDAIYMTLYQRFFAGKILFGIQHTIDQKAALDTVFDNILKTESWTVAQRWRSLASSAPGLEPPVIRATLDETAVEVLKNVQNAFAIVYPTGRSRFKQFVAKLAKMLEKPVKEIVDLAHNLSVALQRDVVTSRLRVVLSLPCDDTEAIFSEQVLSTTAFGLLAIRPGPDKRLKTRVLLAPTTVTASLFSASM